MTETPILTPMTGERARLLRAGFNQPRLCEVCDEPTEDAETAYCSECATASPDRPPVLVVGAGRCGTTMAVQMLVAGGVPLGPEADAISGEHKSPTLAMASILMARPGLVTKVITAGHGLPTDAAKTAAKYSANGVQPRWLVVHMVRDVEDQIDSMARFLAEQMPGHYLKRTPAMRRSIMAERTVLRRQLRYFGDVVELDYDETRRNPARATAEIAGHLGSWFDQAAAVAAVRAL